MAQRIKTALRRFCEQCGTPLERKRFNGRLEDFTRFQRRRHCSKRCAGLSAVVAIPKNDKQYCGKARKLIGTYCEACGTTERLQAHHVDAKRANNHPTNIQTLCITCHLKHHHAVRRAGLLIPGRMLPLNSSNAD